MRASATRTIAAAASSAARPSGLPTCSRDRALRGLDVERFQFAAERTLRIDAAEHDLRVGQGRPRIALPVAGRPRHRAGAFRADLQQPAAIDPGDRAAARADGGDLDHRGADHEAELDRGLRRDRRLAVRDHRDVERGAAEIAGDEIVEARRPASAAPATTPAAGPDSAVRTGSRRAVAVDMMPPFDCTMWICALLSCASACFELGDVGGDDRLQIGVDRRRRGALELADLGQHLVRGGHVVVRPHLAHRGERALLVLGIRIGVDEDDRDGLRALARCSCLRGGADFALVDLRCGSCRRRACARTLRAACRGRRSA